MIGPLTPIQPTSRHITDLAAISNVHIVRLYHLPTPHTNGFTITHSLTPYTSSPLQPQPPPSHGSIAHHHNHNSPLPKRAVASTSASTSQSTMHHLTRLSESERHIVHLARMRISSFLIASSAIPFLSQLVSLRLQGNYLRVLPLQIFRLVSLKELDVSQNLLTEISPLIGLLAPTLEELYLQSNQLESLPQQLGRLRCLRLLDIADNRLGCIPVEVQRLVAESTTPTGRMRSVEEEAMRRDHLQRHHHHQQWDQEHPHQSEGTSSTTTAGTVTGIATDANAESGSVYFAEAHTGGAYQEAGHDDDDYVQIRRGMKCWVRGNRFWQVGVPRSATSASAPHTPAPPPATIPSTSPNGSIPSSPKGPSTTVPGMSLGSPDFGSGFLPLALTGDVTSSGQRQMPGSDSNGVTLGIGVPWQAQPTLDSQQHHHQQHVNGARTAWSPTSASRQSLSLLGSHARLTASSPPLSPTSSSPAPHQHGYNVDSRTGYAKDSYSSWSWTMTLADICSQIVGEKLYKDPHYFCHVESCLEKRTSRCRRSSSHAHHQDRRHGNQARVGDGIHDQELKEEEEEEDECTVAMIPEWTMEQLGLYRLEPLRDRLAMDTTTTDPDFDNFETEKASSSATTASTTSSATERLCKRQSDEKWKTSPPMVLTIREKEMGCDVCSVCGKRLFFVGMRWKGVGVMDERIVPLEWVACSVQCRARATETQVEQQQSGQLQLLQVSVPDSTASSTVGSPLSSSSSFVSSSSPPPSSCAAGLQTRNGRGRCASQNQKQDHDRGVGLGQARAHHEQNGQQYQDPGPYHQQQGIMGEQHRSVLYGLFTPKAMKRRIRTLSL